MWTLGRLIIIWIFMYTVLLRMQLKHEEIFIWIWKW
jgi:hypothetical protein